MEIIQSNAKLRATMNKLLAKEGNRALKNASPRIKRKIKSLVLVAMASCEEIKSLSSGSLKYDFGLTTDPADEIVNAVANSVSVTVRKITSSGGRFSGGVTVGIQPSGYQNLLTLSVGAQEIEAGGSLPWLSWLLTQGDSIIITEYGVTYGSGLGRSGGAKMSTKSAPFKVDSRYSGTPENNFITRALAPYQSQISAIIKEELTR
jgi:hypothetical protein